MLSHPCRPPRADAMNGAPQMSGRVKKTHMRGPPATLNLMKSLTRDRGHPPTSDTATFLIEASRDER